MCAPLPGKGCGAAPRRGALSACRALPSAHEVPEQAARCSGAAGQPQPYCGLRGPESTEGGPPFRSDYDALCLIHFNGIFSPKAALLSKTLSLITMAIQLRYPRRGLPTSWGYLVLLPRRWPPPPREPQAQRSQVFPTALSHSRPSGTSTFFEMVIGLSALDLTPFQRVILSSVVIDTLPASALAIDAHTAYGKQNSKVAPLPVTKTYSAPVPWTPCSFPWEPDLTPPGVPGWGIRWETLIRMAARGPGC